MRKLILWLLVGLLVSASAAICGEFEWQNLKWDNYSDTTFSISSTNADTSMAFRCAPDMSFQLVYNTAVYDSLVLTPEFQFNLGSSDRITAPATNDPGWTATVDGVDSIGYVLTVDSTAGTAIIDCGTTSPVRWARLILAGGSTTDKTTAIQGRARVLTYK